MFALTLLAAFTISLGLEIDDKYCHIKVHSNGVCLGINPETNLAVGVNCKSSNATRLRRFKDGSLRIQGREGRCLMKLKAKPSKTQLLAFGSCGGVFTYNIKEDQEKEVPLNGTFKIFSTNKEFRGYYVDLLGKRGGEVILNAEDDTPKQANHYFDFVNCEEGEGGFLITDSKYSKCPSNHYCPNYRQKKACPNGGRSPAGSASLDKCTRTCKCTSSITLIGNEKLSCTRLFEVCKCPESADKQPRL